MLSLVIIGIMLGVGMAFYIPTSSAVGQAARSVARQLSSARVDAMLGRRKVCLEFEEGSLFQTGWPRRKKACVQTAGWNWPCHRWQTCDDEQQGNSLCSAPLAILRRGSFICMTARSPIPYMFPSIGAPTVRLGMNGLEELRKAVQ